MDKGDVIAQAQEAIAKAKADAKKPFSTCLSPQDTYNEMVGKGAKNVFYKPELVGTYDVYIQYASHRDFASKVPFVVYHAKGEHTTGRYLCNVCDSIA